MRLRCLIWSLAAGVICLAGCSTERGAASEQHYSDSSGVKASPTMRPGMDPQDIRDPNYLNHTRPSATTAP